MENPVPVHVLDRLEQLIHIVFDPGLGQVVLSALDCLIQIHFHDFEDEGQPARRLVVQHLNQLDNVGMGRQPLQSFDFT